MHTIADSSDISHDFSGKTVLITGSIRGVGFVIAQAFAKAGATVYINGRVRQEVDTAVRRIQEGGCGNVMGVQADVRKWGDVQAMCEKVHDACGQIDVVVNNAALRPRAAIEDINEDEWMAVMDTNVGGAFRVSKAVIPMMKAARSGAIVNIASIAAIAPPDYYLGAHYIASKGALIAFTRGLSREVGGFGIRVNAIAPGVIRTNQERSAGIYTYAEERSSLKRVGESYEVASACLFLSSNAASYITGETISLGGYV